MNDLIVQMIICGLVTVALNPLVPLPVAVFFGVLTSLLSRLLVVLVLYRDDIKAAFWKGFSDD